MDRLSSSHLRKLSLLQLIELIDKMLAEARQRIEREPRLALVEHDIYPITGHAPHAN